jgi:hypothetical protein
MRKLILLVFGLFISLALKAQLEFSRGNPIFRPDREHHSGVAGAIADVNGDGYDDLVVLNKSKILEVGINQGPGQPLKWSKPVLVNPNEEYALSVGDIDNDHIAEIVTGGIYSGSKFYKRNAAGDYFQDQNVSQPIYTQSANMVDYNNDGFLDYFACNDQGNNLLVKNVNGSMEVANIIDWSTVPPSDNSGNYGSEWADIDNDGDMDLYVAKCKFGVSEWEDPRRHNMLFINQGNGVFINEAEARGMKHKGQSWTGSFADYDNDGDQDCLITNHDVPHALMRNDGTGHFTEHVLNVPLDASFAFQSLWADFDNNGYLDFLITGADKTYFYMNRDGENFDRVEGVFEVTLNSAALGDINDDGCIDLSAYYGIGINLPGPIRDEIFINKTQHGHFLKFALRGSSSNAMGVGARLELYGSWGKQTREVHAGLSYGVSNSLIQHFGLGTSQLADSLVVYWPSGQKEVFPLISADATYFVQEGKCISRRVAMKRSNIILCPGDNVQLILPVGFTSYLWQNGSTTSSITVTQPGTYYAVATDNSGCEHFSELANISTFSAEHIIDSPGDTVYTCDVNYATLTGIKGLTSYRWSNGQLGASVELDQAGWLSLKALDPCGNEVKDSVYVITLKGNLTVSNDTVAVGETAQLKAIGENISWFSDAEGTNKVSEGNTLTISNIQNSMTYYARAGQTTGFEYESFGEKVLPTGNTYSSNNVDAGLYLNVYKDLILRSFTVQTDLAGVRRFLLIRYEGDTIFRKDVMLQAGEAQRVELNAFIPAGTYYQLKTDHELNQKLFGHDGPRLVRSGDVVNYPYTAGTFAEIPTSIKGASAYYYFYDILLSDQGYGCYSEILPATVVIKQPDQTEEVSEADKIMPNPVNDKLNIYCEKSCDASLWNLDGKNIFKATLKAGVNQWDVSQLAEGIYWLRAGEKTYKVVVAR